jgi:3-oxoadipate enol-lactonase
MLVIKSNRKMERPACKAVARSHDGPMGAISTARGRIGFSEAGAGVGLPIIFLHGVGSDKSIWRPQLDHFSQSRRAVAFDYPGYGESEFVEGATRDDFAASILAAMDALGIDQPHVCGLSLGGVIAIAMYAAAPNRCASLIIADSFATHPDGQGIYDRSVAASEAMTMRELAEARSGMLLGSAATDELRREVIATMAEIDPWAYRIGAEAVWLADQRDRASAISVPTLIIVGDEDSITPPALSEELEQLIPDSRLEVISASGHLANAEQPERFNELVDHFLEEVETAA